MMKTLMEAEENVEDMYYNTTSAFKHIEDVFIYI